MKFRVENEWDKKQKQNSKTKSNSIKQSNIYATEIPEERGENRRKY